jgi:hypothetical protein
MYIKFSTVTHYQTAQKEGQESQGECLNFSYQFSSRRLLPSILNPTFFPDDILPWDFVCAMRGICCRRPLGTSYRELEASKPRFLLIES